MGRKSTIYSIVSHLRFPFSFLLLPVFLFALSQSDSVPVSQAVLMFAVWHLLVYPASNAYNSTQDVDTGPIGGLKNPPEVPQQLLLITATMDIFSLGLVALNFDWVVVGFMALYILISRLYSHRKVRLKQYPWLSVLIIFSCQGVLVYSTTVYALSETFSLGDHQWGILAAGLQVAAIYPLSQIFQHDSDKQDGIKSLSMLLGYKGTFIFTGLVYGACLAMYALHWKENLMTFWVLLGVQLPILMYFSFWFWKVNKNQSEANFTHTMRFTLLSAVLMNSFFTYIIFQ